MQRKLYEAMSSNNGSPELQHIHTTYFPPDHFEILPGPENVDPAWNSFVGHKNHETFGRVVAKT